MKKHPTANLNHYLMSFLLRSIVTERILDLLIRDEQHFKMTTGLWSRLIGVEIAGGELEEEIQLKCYEKKEKRLKLIFINSKKQVKFVVWLEQE